MEWVEMRCDYCGKHRTKLDIFYEPFSEIFPVKVRICNYETGKLLHVFSGFNMCVKCQPAFAKMFGSLNSGVFGDRVIIVMDSRILRDEVVEVIE